MKILFLDHAPSIGGTEVVTLNLAVALERARFAPVFLTSDNAAHLAQLRAREIPAHPLYLDPVRLFTPRGWRMLARGVRAVARFARREQVDVIQSASGRMHVIAALAAPIARAPVVWMLNDTALPRGLARLLAFLPRRITTASPFIRDYYGFARASVILPGVHADTISDADALRDKFKIRRDAPLILNVARLTRAKGQDLLLKAIARMAKETRAHLVLVGAAEDLQYTKELRDLREAEGLFVTFTGHRDDVAHWIAAADIFAHSAIEPEGLGLALLEAMAHGKPVVAFAHGVARDWVKDGETGIFVPPRDVDALARALDRLVQNRAEAKRMGAAGQARVEQEFTIEKQVARYQEIYSNL